MQENALKSIVVYLKSPRRRCEKAKKVTNLQKGSVAFAFANAKIDFSGESCSETHFDSSAHRQAAGGKIDEKRKKLL